MIFQNSDYNSIKSEIYSRTAATVRELMDRRSVRVFTDRKISDEDKTAIILAASEAPTAGCQQLYTILDITDDELKQKLSVTCDNQPFIAKAEMVLVFCTDCLKWYRAFSEAGASPREPGLGDFVLAVTDTAIAAQNAVTAAWSLGIGSCYIGDILEQYEAHRDILSLPDYVVPTVMVVFGYPTEQQLKREKPERIPLSHLVFENAYPDLSGENVREMFAKRCDNQPFDDWMKKFCARKYNSDFSVEMTRSVSKYTEQFR